MKRREFLRNAAIVAASSGIATDLMAAENLLSPIPSPSPEGESKKADSNLQTLIRNVMGDNFYEEDKYLRLSVPSVLFQLTPLVMFI